MKNPLEQLADSHNDVANKGCLDWITGELKILGIVLLISIVLAVLLGLGGIGLSGSQPLPEIDRASLEEISQVVNSILVKGGFLGLVA